MRDNEHKKNESKYFPRRFWFDSIRVYSSWYWIEVVRRNQNNIFLLKKKSMNKHYTVVIDLFLFLIFNDNFKMGMGMGMGWKQWLKIIVNSNNNNHRHECSLFSLKSLYISTTLIFLTVHITVICNSYCVYKTVLHNHFIKILFFGCHGSIR